MYKIPALQIRSKKLTLFLALLIAFSLEFSEILNSISRLLRHGLVVRIAGSHPAGPGSIPGGGILFCSISCNSLCGKSLHGQGVVENLKFFVLGVSIQ